MWLSDKTVGKGKGGARVPIQSGDLLVIIQCLLRPQTFCLIAKGFLASCFSSGK